MRVVRMPAGQVTLDPSGRAAGRGAYLCPDDACWTLALRKGALQHALGVALPPDLRARLAAGALESTEGGTRGT